MPRIEMDELVPEDITFVFRGKEYVIDGDLDVDLTFDLTDLFIRYGQAEADGDRVEIRKTNTEMRDKLLAAFQTRDPALTDLPFGVMAYRIVLGQVLTALGLQIVQEDPPRPRTPAPRPRSRRSTGSRK